MNKNEIPVYEDIAPCDIVREPDGVGGPGYLFCLRHNADYVGPGTGAPYDLVCAATSLGDLADDDDL